MRLEEGGSPYRTTAANKEYKLCETYPRVLVVPAKLSDNELVEVA